MRLLLILNVFISSTITAQSVEVHPSFPPSLNRNVSANEESNSTDISFTEGNILLDTIFSDLLDQTLNNGGFGTADLGLINQWINWFSRLQSVQDGLKDNECSRQLQTFFISLIEMDEWAVRMFDATAKLQSGVLEGNTMQIGSYDECLKIAVFVNGSQINGQYCTGVMTQSEENTIDPYDTKSVEEFKLSYGFCIPAACDNASITEVARLIEDSFDVPLHFQFLEELCDSSVKPKALPGWPIFCIAFFAFVAVLLVTSTLYDIFAINKKRGSSASLLLAFSIYTNGKKLFSTRTSSESLSCLNGMRVISMIWIIAVHRYLYSFSVPLINMFPALEWEENIESTIISSASLAVDTFFLISGLLIVYVFLNHKERGQNVSVIMFYVHRILRLTPALAVLVLFYATIFKYIGSGPIWAVVYFYFQHPCENNWWSTLLYVQNYVHPTRTCISHSWYLAVDTQLYFLSPLLLFPLVKWPKRTISVIMFLIVLSCVVVFTITWTKELGTAFYGQDDTMLTYLYNPTHARAAPWLVGIIMGYVLFHCKNKLITIHKAVVILLWFLSIGIMLAIVLYHNHISVRSGISLLKASLFNSLARTSWALALSIIIFLCVTGYGSIMNKFLSARIFTVLIRVNYSMYLLHMSIIIFDVAQKRAPDFISPRNLFYLFWGDLAITFILSVLWTLAFESPIVALEKILFGKKRKSSSNGTASKYNNNNIDVVIINRI